MKAIQNLKKLLVEKPQRNPWEIVQGIKEVLRFGFKLWSITVKCKFLLLIAGISLSDVYLQIIKMDCHTLCVPRKGWNCNLAGVKQIHANLEVLTNKVFGTFPALISPPPQ